MRTINCQNVCREIEEANLEQQLSEMAMDHLRGCTRCRSFHVDGSRLREIVASLGTVKAPPDFDLRLRARLAGERSPSLGQSGSRFAIAGFSFGFSRVVLASIALVMGAGFLLIVLLPARPSAPGRLDVPNPGRVNAIATEQSSPAGTREPATTLNVTKATPRPQPEEQRTNTRRRTALAALRSNGSTVTRDFSSLPAPVVKRDESVASAGASPIFPIDASYQSLKVSLDDATGISRTIFLPTVSFGSQRVLAAGNSPTVMTSTKGVW